MTASFPSITSGTSSSSSSSKAVVFQNRSSRKQSSKNVMGQNDSYKVVSNMLSLRLKVELIQVSMVEFHWNETLVAYTSGTSVIKRQFMNICMF